MQEPEGIKDPIRRLQSITATLRQPGGCQWDQQQTLHSMRSHLLEEAYEVIDAINRNHIADLREEIGDLFFLVCFLVRLASENGWFNLEDCALEVGNKLIRRHPHVFGDIEISGVDDILKNWESIKDAEKATLSGQGQKQGSSFGKGTEYLPALARAEKVQTKASRKNFDWPDSSGVRAKLNEEIEELNEAVEKKTAIDIEHELGDVLFTVVNLARHYNISPEIALHRATDRFINRFRHMEDHSSNPLEDLSSQKLEKLWHQAKLATVQAFATSGFSEFAELENVETDISLKNKSTLKLGGMARYYINCKDISEIQAALVFAKNQSLPVHIAGEGSNTIYSDKGFDGLILHPAGRSIYTVSESENNIVLRCEAGLPWDEFVLYCVNRNYQGIECLSGIPGATGAVPIQNVGAYGQEVAETIQSVYAIDRDSFQTIVFSNTDCFFGYRKSRFKYDDKDRYVIYAVDFCLAKNQAPEIRYGELIHFLRDSGQSVQQSDRAAQTVNQDQFSLLQVRSAVLALRKKKSMVVDADDAESISAGSFFLNPVLDKSDYNDFLKKVNSILSADEIKNIPAYQTGEAMKISAAYLVEKAGFRKGYSENGVGISKAHSLALVNRGGTAKALIELAEKIQATVYDRFGVTLHREPVYVPYANETEPE